MFVSVASDDTFERVAVTPLGSPSAAYISALSCKRVYFAGGHGVCLRAGAEPVIGPNGPEPTSWTAAIFDDRFQVLHTIALSGFPSRVRLSPDGLHAATTVFENGHSYAVHGFSTRTTIIDVATGRALGDLEAFETHRDGRLFREKDFNFWGVTFARDSDTFYATLATGGAKYLVKGSVARRSMDVVHTGVECPSLSPDNTRIAFKKQLGAHADGWWQLAVLDLATMTERLIPTETHSVDDQVEWLDADRIAYDLTGSATTADVWTVRVDGSARPERLIASAYSPAVLR